MNKTLLVAAALVAAVIPAAGQDAASPLCAFARKVVAAAPGEFASLKGDRVPTDKEGAAFQGTLTTGSDSDCKVFVRGGPADNPVPPKYSCSLGPARTLADAGPVFDKAAADLRACFPGIAFEQKKEGDESKREEAWSLAGSGAGFAMELGLADWGAIADAINGTSSQAPGVRIDFSVEDTSPLPEHAVRADAAPICGFLAKVLRNRRGGFKALASGKRGPDGRALGTARPGPSSVCSINPADGLSKNASYTCLLKRAGVMDGIEADYAALKNDLPKCFHGLAFKENVQKNDSGEPDTRDEVRFFGAGDQHFAVTVGAEDEGWRVRSEPEKLDAATKAAPVKLALSVTDKDPAAKP